MINPEVARKYGTTYHGVLHMPINVCCRCGEEDDPESASRWEVDADDDKVCRKCEQVIDCQTKGCDGWAMDGERYCSACGV